MNELEDRLKQLEETVERIRTYLKGERQRLLEQQTQALADEAKITGSRGRAASENDVIAYCLEQGLKESDGTFFWCKWESSGVGGWYNAGKKIRDWKMVVRQWKAAGWVPSQKHQGNGASQKPMSKWEIKTTLEAIEVQIARSEWRKNEPAVKAQREQWCADRKKLKLMQASVP